MCATTTDAAPARRWRRRAGAAGLAVATALLAACGGGLYLGFGPDDDPPVVALAASTGAAAPGQALLLSADARDDYFVRYVAFYQQRPDGSAVQLGLLQRPPWQLSVVVAADAPDPLTFFARAVDDAGQAGDSAPVVVRVLR